MASSLSLKSNDLFLDIIPWTVLAQTLAYILFDVLQCIFNGFNCGCTLLPIEEKGFGFVCYLVSELR